ncbi:MAG: hypothetical protein GEV28_07735 [Actinophytocola sp.]|uniref:hypothetical protein n=1 Tax=Actinophytocola sp. TaxID=1872138 RepID=UPI0013236C0F|nr:hypothetical protein [Actinophytocola sp.]MPZ80278.1 hypothetical protein [Actinophytocola sp.]
MRLAIPDTVHRIPLDQPERAIREFAALMGALRDLPASAADLEPIATEAVETARREGAFLMAVVTPPDAAPAVLTGVVLEVPQAWDPDTAESLRDAMEDVGGPDVRETVALETGLGPAVVAQRIPGVEQARERRALTLQLQAFVPEPGSGRMLLLTLACPSTHGWPAHQELFARLVTSARPDDAHEHGSTPEPVRRRPAPAVDRTGDQAGDESFEEHTYRV